MFARPVSPTASCLGEWVQHLNRYPAALRPCPLALALALALVVSPHARARALPIGKTLLVIR